MKVVDLSNNYFTGPLVPFFTRALLPPALEKLYLQNNALSGTITAVRLGLG